MRYHSPLMVLATVLLLLGSGSTAIAATEDESARKAEADELRHQLETEYKKALSAAEKDRHAAEAAMQNARVHLHLVSTQRAEAAKASDEQHAAERADMEMIHEELNHARRQLRETSREIARVNREVSRMRAGSDTARFVFSISSQPVIGVILGDANDVGITVLGVSPDGPSERAGIKKGDVIVAMGGRVLAAVDEQGNVRSGLNIVLKEIKANEPVIVSVERGDLTLDLTVVPEIRAPLTWQSVSRFSTAPESLDGLSLIERIVVPEIDTEALAEQIEKIRIEIGEQGIWMGSSEFAPHASDFEFEFHELSEMGNFALHDANLWFGLPMTQGLKLAEIDPGLGEYFKTDRGVLVLKAKTDNDLQLKSGDVILQVGDTEVNSPAEFMRALRDFEAGEDLLIDIKRNRKNRTLNTVMPERRTSFFSPWDGEDHIIKFITKP